MADDVSGDGSCHAGWVVYRPDQPGPDIRRRGSKKYEGSSRRATGGGLWTASRDGLLGRDHSL